jgi:crotonobetainyl-CoA:carnitine CoA-transferase CaiB-like acyl-CoA transferase
MTDEIGWSPLKGLKVLEMGRLIAGPLASQTLGDLGAEVIKVERLPDGDEARHYGPANGVDPQASALFIALNGGKRSIGIDLKRAEGREVLLQLIAGSDVFIHNLRPGADERLGIDYAAVAVLNERLVYCAISGFGETGPARLKAGNDIAAQAYSGLMSFSGEPGGVPVRTPIAIADNAAGMNAAIGILAALMERGVTGRGCRLGTSLLESMFGLLGNRFTEYLMSGIVPEPLGSGSNLGQPNQAFQTQDGWIVIATTGDAMWERCCAALGLSELGSTDRFKSLAGRYDHQDEVVALLNSVTSKWTTKECVDALDAHGVTCAPVNRVDEAAADPQLRALSQLQTVEHRGMSVPVIATPIRAEQGRRSRGRVPEFGEDTDAVLTEYGFGAAAISELRASRAVG